MAIKIDFASNLTEPSFDNPKNLTVYSQPHLKLLSQIGIRWKDLD